MARSATVWAAALFLASMSGSGPMLTTAEAMPAPGPQQTQMRPRYYFPRHVKRQVVANSTAPAVATSSTASSSSKSGNSESDTQLTTRDFSSIVNSFLHLPPVQQESSSSSVPVANSSSASSTVTVVTETVFPVPLGTEDAHSGQSSSTSSPYLTPTSTPSNTPSSGSSESVGSSAGLPEIIVPPASGSPALPSVIPSGPISPSDVVPSVGLPSSIGIPSVLPSVRPTEGIPSPVVAPTNAPVVPTGGIPSSVVPAKPTSTLDNGVPTPTSSSLFGPFIVPLSSSIGGVAPLSPSKAVPVGSTGGIPSELPSLTLPSSIVLPTIIPLPTSGVPIVPLPSSGIIVGITTAFGTDESPVGSPTYTDSAPIPTSESTADGQLPLSSLVSSLAGDLSSILRPTGTGVLPSAVSGITDPSIGPTAPTTAPPGVTPSPIAPPNLSSIISAINSDLSSRVSQVPLASVPDVSSIVASASSGIASDASSILVIPTGTGSVPMPTLPISSILSSLESSISDAISTLLPTPSGSIPIGVYPSSTVAPTGASTGISPPGSSVPAVVSSTGIPVSETLSNTASATETPSIWPSSPSNATGISPSASEQPVTTPAYTPSPSSVEIPFTFTPTQKPTPPASVPITGTDSATTYVVGMSIIQEPTTIASPLPTTSGIPSDLPNMIAPPSGLPTPMPNAFRGQVGFNWRLNYEFVSQNDGGWQIFTYLPLAIADALNITIAEVPMLGLKPYDTTQTLGYVTTLALFYIPADLNTTLAAQLRAPQAPFWHNKNSTVNELTSLINTGISLYGGPLHGDGNPSQPGNPEATETGGHSSGGALGGDMAGSHRVNSTAVGIAVGTIAAAAAYGTAMIFVARRYRNRKLGHKRASSVPSTARYTYGSVAAGGAAWMSGGRGPGGLTPGGPGSRGSHGSSSSNDRSVRTQQISAPVMAENSLGWN